MRQCAFLTMDNLDDFVHYDYMLKEPLAEQGWEVVDVSWRANGVDWNRFEAVIIRSPWDYQDDPEKFLGVLDKIEHSSAKLENPLSLVEWNIDKTYLRDLEKQGIKIVPTAWGDETEQITEDKILTYFDQFETDEIVIKPTVSAGADNTYWLNKQDVKEQIKELKQVYARRAFMVQPFMKHIVDEGEFSLIYFGEEYSHTLLKTPKQSDFRVQEEHGGRLKTVEPKTELRNVADKIMAAVTPKPLYSRVDVVRDGGSFSLMELELIEPSLYFNMDPDSPERFARYFVGWMNNKH